MPTLSDLIGRAVWNVPVQMGPILWSLPLVASFREAGGLGICKKPPSLENTVKGVGRAAWGGGGLLSKMVLVTHHFETNREGKSFETEVKSEPPEQVARDLISKQCSLPPLIPWPGSTPSSQQCLPLPLGDSTEQWSDFLAWRAWRRKPSCCGWMLLASVNHPHDQQRLSQWPGNHLAFGRKQQQTNKKHQQKKTLPLG